MERIFHPWDKWEDYNFNFYATAGNAIVEKHREKIFEVLCDAEICKTQMTRVINEWKYSCEHNLSNISLNRVAYLGQAACANYGNIPAKATQALWREIPEEKRNIADGIAKEVFEIWRSRNEI